LPAPADAGDAEQEWFFMPFRGRLNNLADLYLAAFRGFIVEGGPDTVVAPRDSSRKERRAYSLNRGLDLNHDRRITSHFLSGIVNSKKLDLNHDRRITQIYTDDTFKTCVARPQP
jgi:hypothetical protein